MRTAPWRVPAPDTRLVRQAMRGDRAAVRDLSAQLRPLVLGYCTNRLGADQGMTGAEDCTQEVMCAMLRELPHFPYRTDKFLAWVFGIAAHKISDQCRSRTRHERCTSLPDPGVAAGRPAWLRLGPDDFERVDQHLHAERLLARLPMAYRRVLALRVLFGYSADETAQLLGMSSAAAVRVAQCRALRQLREPAPARFWS